MCKNFFKNINGYPLDKQQIKAATCTHNNSIIIAGAGSGKSTTMIGKIKYLINVLNVKPEEILCISFTNEATNTLRNKIKKNCNIDLEVNTFHKLALKIIEDNKMNFRIVNSNYLTYIIHEFFSISNNASIRKNAIYFLKNLFYNTTENSYKNILHSNEMYCLKKLILKFINLYTAQYDNNEKLINWLSNASSYKELAFFKITYTIYYLYELEKKSQNLIDFDDMIKKATIIVNEGGKIDNYKYIIIDEFQDTSLNRFNLIKAIINKTNAILTVVGDDFQSIYRFSGCTLDLFLNFHQIFSQVKKLKIENTYRNSQELIKIAGNFIMKNPKQIKKNLLSTKHLEKPIKIIYEKDNTLKKLLIYLSKQYSSILILGRNNFNIKKYINNNFTMDKNGYITINNQSNTNIRFLSIHKSKGLEAEVCIILNLINNKIGFPNQIEDHNILKYISYSDNFPYEEERRLLYVALTRSKNHVYLLTEKNNISIFVKELLNDYKKEIEILNKV